MNCLAAVLLLLMATLIGNTSGRCGGGGGKWELFLNSSGVVAMHMALTHRNTVVMLDQTRAGPSGRCLRDRCPSCNRSDPSCWAHSVEYDLHCGGIRPLTLDTDTWCSSGSFLGDGTLLQTGGHGDGARRARYFRPCRPGGGCDWEEPEEQVLADGRWYASNQVLPEGDRAVVVGGRGSYSYEFVPPSHGGRRLLELPFLEKTRRREEGRANLYPFLHLSTDGNLFVFANRDSILLDYRSHRVVRAFPRMPGRGSRSNPNTASSVLLPLDHADGFRKAEVMICGGAHAGAYQAVKSSPRRFLRALSSCGRMVIAGNAEEPRWAMEDMPGPRVMSDMLVLPSGDVLLINGATRGCSGWGRARRPAYRPYLYKPTGRPHRRFSVLKPSTVARMYHSSAIVIPDGRVLVAGSNPNSHYVFAGVPHPTELRVEAFSPPYMTESFTSRRATNLTLNDQLIGGGGGVKYGAEFGVRFLPPRRFRSEEVEFHAYAPPFATHSLSMNQRLLKLGWGGVAAEKGGWVHAVVVAPPSPEVAPTGYYLLSVVNAGVPSEAIWMRFVFA
ncbi:hypothetical protein Taro_034502 [Colocasia esculenta]|uniref:Uncharacterized protein n=1 Tax=Colocasia esculenta TaxID=4460 RepID=A0A843VWK0_COLES|nr:hypothetical protein [Colocasia esculenta]